jgi:hypothetical protein
MDYRTIWGGGGVEPSPLILRPLLAYDEFGAGGEMLDRGNQSNTIFWHPAALYCSIGCEVMLPSACSFIVDVSLSYI